uniref:PHD-type domain-containing protein n=1 Tax=Syphacia muris TaxID=451379 RepID=A0A158R6A2_9BILA
MNELKPIYIDLSQKKVQFSMEAPDSENSSVGVPAINKEHIGLEMCSPVNFHVENELSVVHFNEQQGSDSDEGRNKCNTSKKKQLKKLRSETISANGICPPPPSQPVPIVHWRDSDASLQDIFPKSYAYQVPITARPSVHYLEPNRWEKEREFFRDKYRYWCAVAQNVKVPERERQRLKRLTEQLAWLLNNSWFGGDESLAPPEMLWRARKEEMRRLEQLLVRKQIVPREVSNAGRKDLDRSNGSVEQLNMSSDAVASETLINLPRIKVTEKADEDNFKNDCLTSDSSVNGKRKNIRVKLTNSCDNGSPNKEKKMRTYDFEESECLKGGRTGIYAVKGDVTKKMLLDGKKNSSEANRRLLTESVICKSNWKLYEREPLSEDVADKSSSLLSLSILYRRWSDVLKKLHCEVGPNARLLCKDVESFLKEMKEVYNSLPQDLYKFYEKQNKLKKKLSDNMLDFYCVSWILCDSVELPKHEAEGGVSETSQDQNVSAIVVERSIVASALECCDLSDIQYDEGLNNKCTESKMKELRERANGAITASSYREFIAEPVEQTSKEIVFGEKKNLLDTSVGVSMKSALSESSTSFPHSAINLLPPSGLLTRPKRRSKPPNRFLFEDEELEEKQRKSSSSPNKSGLNEARNNEKRSSQIKKRNLQLQPKVLDIVPVISSTTPMEEFHIVNDDDDDEILDDMKAMNFQCCSAKEEEKSKSNSVPDYNVEPELFNDDVELVEPVRKIYRDSTGRNRVTFIFKAHFYNGVSQEVSERAYKEWKNRQKVSNDRKSEISKKDVQATIRRDISRPIQYGSLTSPTTTSISQSVVSECDGLKKTNTAKSFASPLSIASSPQAVEEEDIQEIKAIKMEFEGGSSGKKSKSIKLKTQKDHLRMILETEFMEKVEKKWMPVPIEGPFSEKVKSVKLATVRANHLLHSPSSTWLDYQAMKGRLQTMIADLLNEFSRTAEASQ